jgi:hypothetical protein
LFCLGADEYHVVHFSPFLCVDGESYVFTLEHSRNLKLGHDEERYTKDNRETNRGCVINITMSRTG